MLRRPPFDALPVSDAEMEEIAQEVCDDSWRAGRGRRGRLQERIRDFFQQRDLIDLAE